MLLLIDNYDSFSYNLYQYLSELGQHVVVARNDALALADMESLRPDLIVISPGPGTPQQAGISNEVILHFAGRVPVLGVCLGHQCIGYSYGATVARASEMRHGKSSIIHHDGNGVLTGLSNPFPAVRYHSLVVTPESLPDCLEVTAWTSDGVIMGLRHRTLAVEGVQFHPESIMTAVGKDLLRNFLMLEVHA